MKRTAPTIPLIATLLTLLTGTTSLQAAEDTFTVYAKVLKVTPVMRRTSVTEPFESCRLVSTAGEYRSAPRRRAPIEPPHRVLRTLVGSLIGGAIGNQIGGGNGRKAATVAGALAGAHIAGRDTRPNTWEDSDYRHPRGEVVEQCTASERVRHVDSVDGYRVRYRYNNQTFTKTVAEHPGDEIALTARVTPHPTLSARH